MKFPNKSSTIWLLFFFLDIYMTRPQGLTFNASIYKTKTRNMFISVLKGKWSRCKHTWFFHVIVILR